MSHLVIDVTTSMYVAKQDLDVFTDDGKHSERYRTTEDSGS